MNVIEKNNINLNKNQFEFKNSNVPIKYKNNHTLQLFLIISLIVLFFLSLFFSTIFALLNINSNKIIRGISVYGVDISNLTVEEAEDSLNSYIEKVSNKTITFNHLDFSGCITLSQLNVNFDIKTAIDKAYSIGRSGNIFQNNFEIFTTLTNSQNINPKINYDSDIFNSLIDVINQNLPDLYMNPNYYIDASNLIIVNGKNGVTTDGNSLLKILLSKILSIDENDISIDLPVTTVTANPIDIDSIYSEIYKKATDAYYLKDPYVVYPSSTGLDFSISIDEAKELLKDYKEEYIIPLTVLYPKISTNDIGLDAFPDKLSEFSTSYQSSASGRSTNIELAASKINGYVLMPGETFSFNQVVGQRTLSAGFKEAAAYSNGQVVQEVGGGICQVSSTLYNAVLYSNLEITERSSHYFNPGYVKAGLDATVSWGRTRL